MESQNYQCGDCGRLYRESEIKTGFVRGYDGNMYTYKEPVIYCNFCKTKKAPECETCGTDLGAVVQKIGKRTKIITNPNFVPSEYNGLGIS
jgi:hypothetical protein